MNPFITFRSKAFQFSKEIYQLSRKDGHNQKTTLLIIGCQRSGTSLMTRIFNKDWNAKVYFESSSLSVQIGEEKLRLKPLPVLKQVIDRERFPLIVLKPLVETQNSPELLDYLPNAKAIWMYRHYRDAACSLVRRFGLGDGISNLRYIVLDQVDDWRAENVPNHVKQAVLTYFSENMNPYDAAALFWYVRNAFFFELGLDCHSSVMPCKYEELVDYPEQTLKRIYGFISRPYPGDNILKNIHNSSVGRGSQLKLSEEIEGRCQQLWEQLEYQGHSFT